MGKYFRGKILQISRVLAVLTSISRLCAADSTRSISEFTNTVLYSACGILLCGYCQVLAAFRPVGTSSTGTASTASTRSSTKIVSICAVYWEY